MAFRRSRIRASRRDAIAAIIRRSVGSASQERVVRSVIALAFCFIVVAQPLAAQPAEVPVLIPKVLNTYPHDSDAFTQGLRWHAGFLYESTGLYGESSLRRVDIESGEPLESLAIDQAYFAEGLELVDGKLIQLTWKAGRAFVYDIDTFALIDIINYEGEGWGLCYDGRFLFMSDSSAYLSLRDVATFDLIMRAAVTYQGQIVPPQLLNELECVGEHIYANAWNTDYIFRIDKWTGEVTAVIDASTLLTEAERAELAPGAVLNGIAWNPDSDTFFITGKKWNKLFEVVFVAA